MPFERHLSGDVFSLERNLADRFRQATPEDVPQGMPEAGERVAVVSRGSVRHGLVLNYEDCVRATFPESKHVNLVPAADIDYCEGEATILESDIPCVRLEMELTPEDSYSGVGMPIRTFPLEGLKEVESLLPAGSLPKVGRNDPCPCGSGSKAKRCCSQSG